MDDDTLKKVSSALAHTAKIHGIKSIKIKFAGGEPTLEIPLLEKFRDLIEKELNGSGIEIAVFISKV